MREYEVELRTTYNMGKTSFLVGIRTRSERIFIKAVKRHEFKREKLQKTHNREFRAAARPYNKKQAETANVARQ
jgi:hypothetical protein